MRLSRRPFAGRAPSRAERAREPRPPLSAAAAAPYSTASSRPEVSFMQRIPRDLARKYAFDARDQPLLRVQPGETFEVETWDASTGYFKSATDKAVPSLRPGFDRSPPLANPIAGPVHVEGAAPGDTLVVIVEEIRVADYSW